MKVIIQRLGTTPTAVLLDVGNTRIGIAPWYNKQMHAARHVTLAEIEGDPDLLRGPWEDLPIESERYFLASSVSPPVLERLAELIAEHCPDAELLVLGQDLAPPIKTNLAEPDKIGMDRLCVAAAAHKQLGRSCVVASLGTAVTVDLISDDAVFMGGAILPGLQMGARALHEQTALLPEIQAEAPSEIWGTRTDEAMRIGLHYGLAGAVRELTERYATELGQWPPLVLTGGDAAQIAASIAFATAVAPDLCLRGVALAFEQAIAEAESS
jgi:type III pantothenate kinase